MITRCFFYFLLVSIFSSTLVAQPDATSGSVYEIAFDSALAKLNKPQLAIYTGREYYPYFIKKSGYSTTTLTTSGSRPGEHPFFITDEFRSETIEFDGVVYSSVNLAFDICRSEVVVLAPQRRTLVLPAGKVKRFNYAGHRFEFLAGVKELENDFYDILYSSDSATLCVKRRKNQTELWHTISEYFIIVDNQAFPVSLMSTKNFGVKSTLLKILSDEEDQVRTFIRKNNLKFSKSKKETSLIRVVEYYASLKTK